MNNPVANRIRYPLEPVHGVSWATKHAVERWKERSGSKKSLLLVAATLEKLLADSKEAYMDPGDRLAHMLRHDCQPAEVRMAGQYVLVIEGDTVVTVHQNERGLVKKGKPPIGR